MIGTQWVERDSRFTRVVTVVAIVPSNKGSGERVGRMTVRFNGVPAKALGRVTYGDRLKFMKRFAPTTKDDAS